jgi:two-component system sensor histidine kinase SenX3
VADLLSVRRRGRRSGASGGGIASVDALTTALVASLPAGVLVVDEGNVVTLVNSAAERLGIYSGDLTIRELQQIVWHVRDTGQPYDAEVRLPPPVEPPLRRPRRDKPGTDVRARATPLGSLGDVAIVLDDLSDAKRVEAVRRDFVANVSHELKTPVGALRLLAEAVLSASDDPEAVRRFAGRIAHESTRLSRLVQDLIDLSRLQGGDPLPEPAPVSLRRVVAEAVDRTRLVAEAKNIRLVVVGDQPITVQGDEGQLVTALSNLIDNAVAYSPEGTRVVVGVRTRGADEEPGEHGIATVGADTRKRRGDPAAADRAGGQPEVTEIAEISVADEGAGIPETEQERVFERFYRVDPARSRVTGGTGLGLAIVKHVVTNHGGSVSLWSSEGVGSTFTLHLPVGGRA